MSDIQIVKLLKLVKELRNQIEGQQEISSPNKLLKDQIDGQQETRFNENPKALIELQQNIGYRFKEEELLKRAVDLFSEGWENEHGVLRMVGKSVIQTCETYRLVKENPAKLSKSDVQTSLNAFFGGREYMKGARGLGLEAFVRNPTGNCKNGSKKSFSDIDSLFSALIGALALDSSIEHASFIFSALTRS